MSQSTPRRPTRFASAIHPTHTVPLSSSLSRVVVVAAAVSLARSLARFKESGSKPIRWNYHRIGAPNFVRSIERAPTSTFAFASAGGFNNGRARADSVGVRRDVVCRRTDGRTSTSTSARSAPVAYLGVGAFGHSERTRFIHHSQKKNSWNTNACGRFDVL